MEHSKLYLGLPLHALNYEHLQKYFEKSPLGESDKIEYKSYNTSGKIEAKFDGLIESVCSFLNSEGGLLIWGAPMGVKVEGRREKIFQGELTPIDTLIEKDRFISIISDRITPTPIGVKIETVMDSGRYIYIFEIQKSYYSPHQYKNTYYMRIDGQKKPAPHSFIEAMFRKVTFPNLSGSVEVERVTYNGSQQILNIAYVATINNSSTRQNELGLTLIIEENKNKYNAICPSILHYANPFRLRRSFGISGIVDEFKIRIWFGGEKSPLKFSEFLFSFDKGVVDNMKSIRSTRNYMLNISDYEIRVLSKDKFP